MSGAGLWLPAAAYLNTGDTPHTTFTIRIKVKPDQSQSHSNPMIVTAKGYFAASFSDFPWDLSWSESGQANKFGALHDSGNDFVADLYLRTLEYEAGMWYDIVMVQKSNGYVRIWIDSWDEPGDGKWYEVTAGGMGTTARNICVGRAPFEQSGGVNNSGWAGEFAHYEYWAADLTAGYHGADWLRNWRPPMIRETATHPTGLGRYFPVVEKSGTNTREWVNQTDVAFTNPSGIEWRNSFEIERKNRRYVACGGMRRRAA